MSRNKPGTWVDGEEMLNESIAAYFATPKGSVPLHVELGFDIYKYADRNTSSLMNMVREITRGLPLWDSRLNVVSVKPKQAEDGKVQITVTRKAMDPTVSNVIVQNYWI